MAALYYKFLNERHIGCIAQIFDLPDFRNHRPFRLSAISSIPPSSNGARLVTVQGFFNLSFVFCSTSHEMNTRSCMVTWCRSRKSKSEHRSISPFFFFYSLSPSLFLFHFTRPSFSLPFIVRFVISAHEAQKFFFHSPL